MKILTTIILMSCLLGYSQKSIELTLDSTSEILAYKKNKPFKIPINLNVIGQYIPKTEDKITVTFITDIEELNPFLKNNKIVINNSKISDSISFSQEKENKSNLNNILDSIAKKHRKFTLKMASTFKSSFIIKNDTLNDTIQIKEANLKKVIFLEKENDLESKKTYNFYLGTNFDLKDRFEANSFYSEIDVFLPNLFFKNSRDKKFGGIRAGIFKNNSVSSLKEYTLETETFEVTENTPEKDSISFERKRVIRTPKISYENLGLYFEILLEISALKNKNFQAFIAPHAEIIQRTETTNFDTEDFLFLGRETIHRNEIDNKFRSLVSINRERTNRYYTSYFGVGLPMKYSNEKIEVFLNPIIGFGKASPFRSNSSQHTKGFGVFQFHMKEKKHGVKLSGDIRKHFGENQDPFIVINLSKSINIESLLDSNK